MSQFLDHLPAIPWNEKSDLIEAAPSSVWTLWEEDIESSFSVLSTSAEVTDATAMILEVLDRLDRTEQVILDLHYMKGFSIEQTAYVMQMTSVDVEELRRRALARIRNSLHGAMLGGHHDE